jgi:CubicO group peptidase (beta-lactamase class C family)
MECVPARTAGDWQGPGPSASMSRPPRSPRAPWLLAGVATAFLSALAPLPLLAQLDPASVIARVEAPQVPDRGGDDALSIPELMGRLHVPGVSLAVIHNFRVAWVKSYGVADVASGQPVEATTLFQAASISKPVTAMAATWLAQERRLRLDDDINAVLRSWRLPPSKLTRQQPVTPRALLSHTSGAADGFGFPGYAPGDPLPSLVQILQGQPPANRGPVVFARPPYERYQYSGGGFVVMQLALTDLTGQPFADVMQAAVLAPLGMGDSSFQQPIPAARSPRAARAHDVQGRRLDAPWHVYPEQAAAGLWTTPTDLARFVIEVQTALRGPRGRVLSQASARQMVAPVGTGPFAVGLSISKRGEGWYVSHPGGNWGFRAEILGHLLKGYGVVVMTNSDAGEPLISAIESRVAAAYGWDSLDRPLAP